MLFQLNLVGKRNPVDLRCQTGLTGEYGQKAKADQQLFKIIVQLPFPDISRNIITEIGPALLDRREICARINVKGLEILRLCNLVGKLS